MSLPAPSQQKQMFQSLYTHIQIHALGEHSYRFYVYVSVGREVGLAVGYLEYVGRQKRRVKKSRRNDIPERSPNILPFHLLRLPTNPHIPPAIQTPTALKITQYPNTARANEPICCPKTQSHAPRRNWSGERGVWKGEPRWEGVGV